MIVVIIFIGIIVIIVIIIHVLVTSLIRVSYVKSIVLYDIFAFSLSGFSWVSPAMQFYNACIFGNEILVNYYFDTLSVSALKSPAKIITIASPVRGDHGDIMLERYVLIVGIPTAFLIFSKNLSSYFPFDGLPSDLVLLEDNLDDTATEKMRRQFRRHI